MSRIVETDNNPSLTFKDFTDDDVFNIGCRYILPEDVKHNLQSCNFGSQKLNAVHINIHSIPSKINQLRKINSEAPT